MRCLEDHYKKLPKYKAAEIAKKHLVDVLSVAYYGFEDNNYYQSLSEDEQELINQYMNIFGQKMAKSIGKEYFAQ